MPETAATTEYLNPQDCADEVDTTARNVRRWCESGELPCYYLGRKTIRIRRDDWDAFLAARRRGDAA